MCRKTKYGFTLMEMLVVVAIIGILVAVSIPVFSSKLQSAREAVCAANRRSLKALLSTAYMTDGSEENVSEVYNENKAEFTCPLGGEITYKLSGGVITTTCSHLAENNPLADADKMGGLYTGLNKLNKTNVFYNPKSSDADKKIISDALNEAGVDLNSLTSWALRYDNGDYPKLYWSDEDVSKITEGTVYAMAYTLTSKHYTVWKVTVKDGVITGEVNDSLVDKVVENQTYEKSLALFNKLKTGE